ncbi:MAG: TIGR04255 family protein [Methylotenera sp.]|nr:TIGR04255 family protein [Methylotenera sp.]MDD4926434.1 TIGR04255 family protein [Methylotenera sp.]
MTGESNTMNCNIVPSKGSHAVQSAVFVLELSAPVLVPQIKAAIECYESSEGLRKFFPTKTENRGGISIAINGGDIAVEQNQDIDGVVFQRLSSDGSLDIALTIQANNISYTCNKYTRWKETSQQALSMLKEFVKYIFPELSVTVIGLQYIDEFLITGEVSAFTPSMILNDNQRVPHALLSQKGGWHNHSGWFESNEENDRNLINLNFNMVPQPENAVFQIVTVHREIKHFPIKSLENLVKDIDLSFEKLHERNKTLLREILNDETQSTISLGKP